MVPCDSQANPIANSKKLSSFVIVPTRPDNVVHNCSQPPHSATALFSYQLAF
jgi:hypothetical protein